MALDPGRVVSQLRELQELTGDENGAQRVAWTDIWNTARSWLDGLLDGLPLERERDAAGNDWWTLRGESERAVLIGGHIDSVPNGGWLDGCLNVLAGVEVLRRIAAGGTPPVTVRLVIVNAIRPCRLSRDRRQPRWRAVHVRACRAPTPAGPIAREDSPA